MEINLLKDGRIIRKAELLDVISLGFRTYKFKVFDLDHIDEYIIKYGESLYTDRIIEKFYYV